MVFRCSSGVLGSGTTHKVTNIRWSLPEVLYLLEMRLTRECFMDKVKVKSKVMDVGRTAGKKGN